tara:strand:+ start:213 stop:764 length:552 start_codon:yes stop_codon:yes gene_type:complete
MRKALLALAPVLALCGGAASALEPWPTVTDRAALADFRLQADYDTCSAELVGGAEMALTDHLGTGADGEGYYPLLIVEQDTANRYKVGSFVKMKFGNDLAWGKVVAARGNRTTFAMGAGLLRELWYEGSLPFIEFEATKDLFDQDIYDQISLFDPEGMQDAVMPNRQLLSGLRSCYEGLSMEG